ncbi:MAG: PAS domain S-box protein, partial [Armatimonadetes bacterium]|nr:PAS domain S-box protein [Armatimonadota bacterium]
MRSDRRISEVGAITPNAFSAILWLTAAVAAALASYAWRRRAVPGAAPLALSMAAMCVWLFGYGAELAVATLAEMQFWTAVQYPGIALLPVANLLFALHYSGARDAPSRLGAVTLLALPVATFTAVWTNDWHHWYYKAESVIYAVGMAQHALTPGPLYWVFLLYAYACLCLAAIVLYRMQATAPPRFAQHARILLFGVLAPFGLAIARALGWRPFGVIDITVFGFVVTTACIVVLVLKHSFLDLGPLARDSVVDELDHGILVLDGSGRVLDANASVLRVLGLPIPPCNETADQVLGRWPDLVACCASPVSTTAEVAADVGGASRRYEVTVSPITEGSGALVGRSLVWRDVTAAQAALEALSARDRLLEAQASATYALLVSDGSESGVKRALETIGRVLAVDRAYVFENGVDPQSGGTVTSQRYEWVAQGVEAMLDDAMLQARPYAPDFARWLEELRQGRTISGLVSGFPESERQLLQAQGIVSLLVVPIILDDRLWGFVGFDECAEEREWSDAETSSLTVLAAAIGSAVLRNRTVTAVKESERRFRSYFDLPIAGTAICSPHTIIQIANKRLGEMLGYSEDELQGLDWTSFLRSPDGASQLTLEKEALSSGGTPQPIEARCERKDGTQIDVELGAQIVRTETGQPECVVVMNDVTRRKLAEAEFKRIRDTLNQEVDQRTQDLGNANRELEAFAVAVSNDLRAPLRWVDGFSRVLAEEYAEALDTDGARLIERVRDAARQATDRLDALMRLTTVARMEMSCITVDLSEMAREICEEIRSEDPSRGIELRIEPSIHVYGCPSLLRIALRHLL